MSATERIRALLDQRGVGHIDYGGRGHDDETGKPATWWSSEQGECAAIQRDDDLLTVEAHLTPEQAVEATLGRGTCKDIAEFRGFGTKTEFKCSECGYEYSAVGGFGCDYGDEPDFNYCPNCGRKVES